MAGFSTPVLNTLGIVNSVRDTASAVDRTLGISRNRRRRVEEREARTLLDTVQGADLDDLRARQAEDLTTRRTALNTQAARIRAEGDAADRTRTRALRRAVGRVRAQLGGQGISTSDGSGEAILLGLVREAEEDAADARRLDTLRLKALEEEDAALQRRNLLDLTRLQERQRLERLARGWD